ncbi:hypothetical protein F0562_026305 [Nyssa sinensis]|uniref:Protein kinase domain-containing protein n=1 Tax=Nyssa sinensis TaxID=561372 RepID=A0A5J5B8V2_9ASTE|nr:hypothetical protein F0562_026305 [Nyssa sinensis]
MAEEFSVEIPCGIMSETRRERIRQILWHQKYVHLSSSSAAATASFSFFRKICSLLDLIKGQISSAAIKGTVGYVAPEYGMGGEVSTEGDVYSYGILLLEMITGKRPTDKMFKDGLSLHSFCKMTFPERVEELVDSCLLVEEINEVMTNRARNHTQLSGKRVECLLSIIQIGIACSVESPGERMDIQDVIRNLHQVKQVFLGV